MTMNNDDRSTSILILEAIRAGIPSRITVDAIPDLRSNLFSKIENDLDGIAMGKQVKGRLVWGEYGQGKTHLLKTMEQHILAQGFAVSYLSLSKDLCLNNLHNLLPALAAHLQTPDSQIPGLLNPLTKHQNLGELRESLSLIVQKLSHPLPWHIFQTFLQYDANSMILLYNALMGKKENLTTAKSLVKSLFQADYKRMPKFIQRDHLLSFWEFIPYLLKGMGYKGWVILLDELEIIGRQGKIGRLNSYKNLSWLLNWGNQHNLPIYTLGASVKSLQDEVFYGKKKVDAIMMPELASERFDEQTAESIRNFFVNATNSRNLILAPIHGKDIPALFSTLMSIHQSAIAWSFEPSDNFITDSIKQIDPQHKPVRQIVRMFIEIMDVYAISGKLHLRFVENLYDDYDYSETIADDQSANDELSCGFTEKKIENMFDM